MGNRIAVVTFMEKRVLHSAVAALLVLILSSTAASAATFYVRVDGSDSNSGLTNDATGAWRTIDYAADRVAAGDTVRVQAGTYAESVTPAIGGTVSAPITFVADGAVTFCTLMLGDGNNYLRFIGFTIDTDAGSCVKAPRAVGINNGSTTRGVEFWNNTIRDATAGGITTGASTTRANNWVLIGNVIENLGPSSAVAVSVNGDNNFFAYNEIRNIVDDVFAVSNTRNSYFLNNYTHGITEVGHPDIFQAGSSTNGLSYNTFEATFQQGSGASAPNEHTSQISHAQSGLCVGSCGAMTENLFRFNVFHNLGSGTIGVNKSLDGPITFTRAYHNSTVKVVRGTPTNPRAVAWFGAGTTDNYLLNDLFYEGWGTAPDVNPDVFYIENIFIANYNLAYNSGGEVTFAAAWTRQADEQSNVNPHLVNADAGDFTLGASSGAIGAAGPLTATSGSGTGTIFKVAAGGGGFFRGANNNITQYGGKLTAGDVITVGTDTRTVVSVSGDSITVDSSLTWANAEPVYFGDDTTPDIGAFPYKAGGYTLSASYAMSGSTATIIPSDASLVRFVICYSDGVPYAVDNNSPYTCAAPTGTFSARVYPRYASKTLWVTVGAGPSVPLSAPKNLKLTGY